MQVNPSNNLNALTQAQTQMNDLSQRVADITNPAATNVSNSENRPVTDDLLKAITEQIPTQIAYEATGTAIKVENAVHDALLDIKA